MSAFREYLHTSLMKEKEWEEGEEFDVCETLQREFQFRSHEVLG